MPYSKCPISSFHYMQLPPKRVGDRLTAPTMLRKATHLSTWLHCGLQRFRRALLPCGLHRRVAIPCVPIRVAFMATPIWSRSRDYGLWAHHANHCARIPSLPAVDLTETGRAPLSCSWPFPYRVIPQPREIPPRCKFLQQARPSC